MTLFDEFDRIAVINLPSRPDRRRAILKDLARAGIAADDPRLVIFPAIRPEDAGAFPSIGAHGCFRSHLGVITAAERDGVQRLLILEDDLQLQDAACHAQELLAQGLRGNDWCFAYPGHTYVLPKQAAGDPERAVWLTSDAPLVCAHFYALHHQILGPLRQYLEACLQRPAGDPAGGPMHVDGAFSMFRAMTGATTLLASPSLGGQRSSRSDIHANRWYDRWPGVAVAVAWLRRCRNHFATA